MLPLYGYFAVMRSYPTTKTQWMQAISLGTAIAVFSALFTPAISCARKPMADDRDILTVREICDLFQVHPSTLYKMIKQGKIPAFRIGSEWRFRKDVIMRWMAQWSMETQQVKKVIDTGVDGEARHRPRAGSRGPRR